MFGVKYAELKKLRQEMYWFSKNEIAYNTWFHFKETDNIILHLANH